MILKHYHFDRNKLNQNNPKNDSGNRRLEEDKNKRIELGKRKILTTFTVKMASNDMTTSRKNFDQGVSTLLHECIFPAICELVASKGVMLTPEEIRNHLQMPIAASAPVAAVSGSANLPAYLLGTGTPAAPVKKATKSTKVKADTNGPQCMYVFQRGDNRGKQCTNSSPADGFNYCREHRKNTTVAKDFKKFQESGGVMSPEQPISTPTLPPSMMAQPQVAPVSEPSKISVVPYEGREDYFYEIGNHFILRSAPNGGACAFYVVPPGEQPRLLNQQERQIAVNMSLYLVDDAEATKVMQKLENIQVQSQPQAMMLPQIAQQAPSMSSFQIPTIPTQIASP